MSGSANASSYVLGGTISGAGGSGASVELTGATSASAMANSSGVYSFTGLQNGSYTVTPSNEGYVMTPASQAVTLNGSNSTANFSSLTATYTISGTIAGAGGPGAVVELAGAASASVIANEREQYSFAGITDGSYTVTPKSQGYVMTPISQAVTVNGANATANFAAAHNTLGNSAARPGESREEGLEVRVSLRCALPVISAVSVVFEATCVVDAHLPTDSWVG